MKVNPIQSPISQSALMNSAAKDDILQTDDSNNYQLSDIMKNDPGSAHFYQFLTDGVHLNGDGSFSFDDDFSGTSFQYQEQLANGTFSTATVSLLTHLSGDELVSNFSFEDGQTTTGGAWQGSDSLPSWDNLGVKPLEVVSDGYFGITGGSGHWLDTEASPGGIDIQTAVQVDTGAVAKLDISLSAEQLTALGLQTSPDEHLQVLFDGHLVGDFTQADLGDYNHFHDLSMNVVGEAGTDHIEIHSVGADNSFVGFALDSVSLHQYEVV